MNLLDENLKLIDNFMYKNILIFLLIISGVYFSIKTGFVQLRRFPEAIKVLKERDGDKKSVSSFQALMISTASRVGTGNIAGVATAITLGGPGSIFWMWVLAIIGSASAFIESTLAQIYKEKDGNQFIGGPAYYIQKALKRRKLGVLFAVLLILCFGYGFNALQSFNVGSSIEYYFGEGYNNSLVPFIVGGILAIATAFVIFGGVHRIGIISSVVVPVMAILYIGLGFYICMSNVWEIPEVLNKIFHEAFDFQKIFAGFAGSCVIYGAKRGLFSNEAGMGSAPNASATATVNHPVKQGLVQVVSVCIDTLLICSTTAMILMFYKTDDLEITGMAYVQQAIKFQVGELGIHFITVSIILFAYSSIIGNYCYAESNLKFIKNNGILLNLFRGSVVFCVFIGALANLDTIWCIADILMGFMALVNIIAILLLGDISVSALKDYDYKKRKKISMNFKASDIGLDNTDVWK